MTSVKLGGCAFRWWGEVAARNESAVLPTCAVGLAVVLS